MEELAREHGLGTRRGFLQSSVPVHRISSVVSISPGVRGEDEMARLTRDWKEKETREKEL